MQIPHVKALALRLMRKHGLTPDTGWELKFYQNTDKTAGRCRSVVYDLYGDGPHRVEGTIELNRVYCFLNDEYHVKDVILHEIAHALTPGHNHDETWRAKALEIGCAGTRCTPQSSVAPPPRPRLIKHGRRHTS
jgi:SprT-like family protein